MEELEKVKKEIEEIKARTKRVEMQKAWETSVARKVTIIITTYVFMFIVFSFVFNSERPYLDAIVPTFGFFLSTLSLGIVKDWWLKKRGE